MEIAAIIFIVFAFLVGLLGTVLPAVPGAGLIFLGVVAYAWAFGVEAVGVGTLIAFGVATVLSFLFDYLGQAYGAKRAGSTWWGVIGAVLGGVFGAILFNIPGLILGIFFGAAVSEMIFARKDTGKSFRIGLASVIGFLGGAVIKLIIGLSMILVFLAKVLL